MEVDDVDSLNTTNNNENDEVVKEVNVYLSKSLSKNLYLFQYPIRAPNSTYDNAEYLASRVKPKHHKFELEVALDTINSNYSKAKGEQFALNVDGKPGATPIAQRYYKSSVMDKQVLVSTNASIGSMSKHYAVGMLNNNELHLTPLQSVVQLKPSFEYFDISEKKVKDAKDAPTDTDYSTEEEDNDADKTELITLKYARDSNAATKQAQPEEQNWINTTFVNNNEPNSIKLRKSLYCKEKTETNDFDSIKNDYLNKLMGLN